MPSEDDFQHIVRNQTRMIKIMQEIAVNYANLERKVRMMEIALAKMRRKAS